VKKNDSMQKNERKMKRNDKELNDYNEKAKNCDEDHEDNTRMKLNDETTDLNYSSLDSGQVNNDKEDGTSKTRGEVKVTIKMMLKWK